MSDPRKDEGTGAIHQVWIGESAPVQWIKTQLKEVADTDLPVLLQGEPGTGRRLAARTVHALSPRRHRPFVQVDCAAFHEARLAHDLFGCAPALLGGAPAPAHLPSGPPTRCELAHGGTLFLDEVDTLPAVAQSGLLRLLKDQCIQRAGAPQPIAVDVRMIAATQRDLGRMTRAGMFCPELFYRLSIVPVKLPPLRERRKDIPLLAMHFVYQCAARMRQETAGLSQEAMTTLLAYDWPGNVWELKRILERAVVLAGREEIRPEHLQQSLQAGPPQPRSGQPEDIFLLGVRSSRPPGSPELN